MTAPLHLVWVLDECDSHVRRFKVQGVTHAVERWDPDSQVVTLTYPTSRGYLYRLRAKTEGEAHSIADRHSWVILRDLGVVS